MQGAPTISVSFGDVACEFNDLPLRRSNSAPSVTQRRPSSAAASQRKTTTTKTRSIPTTTNRPQTASGTIRGSMPRPRPFGKS